MKINDVEFELNLSDSNVLEDIKIEVAAFNNVDYKINQMEISIREKIMMKEELICITFRRIFGEGADRKVFKNGITISKGEAVLRQFNRELNKQYSKLKGIVIQFPTIS